MKYSYSLDRSRAISFETRQSSHVNLVIYTHLLNKAKDDSLFYLVFLHLHVNSKLSGGFQGKYPRICQDNYLCSSRTSLLAAAVPWRPAKEGACKS